MNAYRRGAAHAIARGANPEFVATAKRMEGFDANPHSGIQSWSKGDLFPAVIFRTERYSVFPSFEEVNAEVGGLAVREEYERGKAAFYGAPLADRLESKWWSVILDGVVEEGYASYDEAKEGALGLLAVRYAFQRDAERQRAARVVA